MNILKLNGPNGETILLPTEHILFVITQGKDSKIYLLNKEWLIVTNTADEIYKKMWFGEERMNDVRVLDDNGPLH